MLAGYKYVLEEGSARLTQREQWCRVACGYALQAAVRNARAHAPAPRPLSPRAAFPAGDALFLVTKGQYYGCEATVSVCFSSLIYASRWHSYK